MELKKIWRGSVAALAVIAITLAALFSINFSPTSFAQGPSFGTATPTPDDFNWLAFVAARTALEEKFKVDLFYVRDWSTEFGTFDNGLEVGCRALVAGETPTAVYTGWTVRVTALNGSQYQARVANNRSFAPVVICDNVTQVSAGAGAATSAAGNLPTAVAGSGATSGFALGGHASNFAGATIETMRSAGMTWVKKQVRFNLGDDPNGWAGNIGAAKTGGFKILLGVVGQKDQMGNYDQYIASYSQYVAGLARAGADAIEVWNEPNIDREWPVNSINGGTYTRLLAAAYNAIKQANPNTLVISGAPAPTGFFGTAGCSVSGSSGGCNDDVFMQQMRDAGAAQYMDCIGLHYNEGIVPPTQNSGDPRGEYPSRYYQSMTQRGFGLFGGKPVCYTELGYLSPEGYGALPAGFEWARNVTIAQQAEWLASAASIAAQSGRVRILIIWNVDFTRYDSDPMAGFAIIRKDGTCPACARLRAVMGR
jgi:hypothetical protein